MRAGVGLSRPAVCDKRQKLALLRRRHGEIVGRGLFEAVLTVTERPSSRANHNWQLTKARLLSRRAGRRRVPLTSNRNGTKHLAAFHQVVNGAVHLYKVVSFRPLQEYVCVSKLIQVPIELSPYLRVDEKMQSHSDPVVAAEVLLDWGQ